MDIQHNDPKRKQMEEELRASKERYRLLVENIDGVIYTIDTQANVTYVSPTIEQIFGYTADEILGRSVSRLLHPDDLPYMLTRMRKALAGEPKPTEFRLIDKKGDIHFVRTYARPVKKAGRLEGLNGILIDITEQKRAEEALREKEERLNLAIEGANLGIWDWDVASDEVVSNSCLAHMFGYPPEELDGKMKTWLQLVHPEDLLRVENVQQDLLDGSVILGNAEFRLRCSDGNWRWAHFQGKVVLRDDLGHPHRITGVMQDITERKLTEENVKKLMDLSETLVDISSPLICVMDLDGKVLFWNKATEEFTGYAAEEVVKGREIWDALFPDPRSRAEVVDTFEEIKRLGAVKNQTTRISTKEGEDRSVTWNGLKLVDGMGNAFGLVFSGQDQTKHLRMKDEMMAERGLSQSIVEGADFFIVGFDRQGRISLFNRGGEMITGHRAGDVLGKNFFDLLIPERVKATFRDHIEALAEGRPNGHMDGPVLTCSGEEVHLQWGWSVIRGESGEVERIIAFGQDISYRRWLEEQMFLFMDAIESSNDGIAIFDEGRCLIFANPALLDMYGTHLEDVLGRLYKDFILETDEGLQIEGNSWQGRVSCIRTDGTSFPASVSVAPVVDKDGRETAIIAVVRDISQSIEYEQKLKSLNSELERFAYTVSHDLRAPLRGIQGFATVLQEDYGDLLDETGRRYLDRIKDISANMDLLVLDLLDYSRVGRIVSPPQKVDLRDLVTEAYEDVKSLAGDGEVRFTITGDFPVMNCERSRIKQVFANLLSNSLKYARGPPVIEVGCIDQGDAYEFYVKDEGIGFEMDYHDRIFEPFIRLKRDGEGTGIGLATAKKIVETCGGKIWAESSPEKGSTFRFILPNKQI